MTRRVRTTDEWTEDFYPAFAKDIDVHISMHTDLTGEDAYMLRRHIMISLRGGPQNETKLTDHIDKLGARCRELQTELDAALKAVGRLVRQKQGCEACDVRG
jgi:hypothetical protein